MVYKLGFFSLMFEMAAIWLLFSESRSTALIYQYLSSHAVSSALFALAALLLMPSRYRQQRWLLLGLLFAFNLLVPIISQVAQVVGLVLYRTLPKVKKKVGFATMESPRFTTERSSGGTGFRGGQARTQLGDVGASVGLRMQALIAVQDTPIRAIGPLLRTLLTDPVDDLRLLAYGILDNREKSITRGIVEGRHLLAAASDDAGRFDARKTIAGLYWELIYQNLVQGDMQIFSSEQAREHARLALEIDAEDAGLWFILARLELARGNTAAAKRALLESQRQNFPPARLAPYFAELEFRLRRFDRVRELLRAADSKIPSLDSARHYWTGPGIAP